MERSIFTLTKYAVTISFLLLIAGCVAVGEKYKRSEAGDSSKSLVFIYRPHPPADPFLMNTYAYVHTANLYHGEQKLISMDVGCYTYVEVESGTHIFYIREQFTSGELIRVELETEPGQRYYLRYHFRFGAAAHISFEVVANAIAESEIANTRFKTFEAK